MRLFACFVISFLASGTAWAANARVAVLEFVHTGQNADWAPMGKGFQEMFLVDLSKAEAIDVVARHNVREQRLAIGLDLPADDKARLELGRKSGATHLLSGSFSVKGDELTMQAELQDMTSGATLLSKSTTVQTEAFFDAQKDMMTASIGAMKITLAPRERAETGRLHTADLLAFQDFSAGLDSFDTKEYEASITKLRSATKRDAQFSLAAITLDDYEKLISDIRDKADAIHVVRAEEKRLQRLGAAGEQIEVIRKLLAIAATGGKSNERQRTTALFLLAVNYSNIGRNRGKLSAVRALEDKFAMKRAGDELMRKYHLEAMALWPALPPQFEDRFYRKFPELETFDKDFENAIAMLWENGADYPENRKNYLLSSLRYPYKVAVPMHLTLSDEVALHDTFVEMAVEIEAPEYWLKSEVDERVKSYREVLRFDDSTRLLDQKSRMTDNEYALRGIASEIEVNKEYKGLLKGAADKTLMEEWIGIAMAGGWSKGPIVTQGKEEFSGRAVTDDGAYLLTQKRKWPTNKKYLRVGSIPGWCVQKCYWLWSGQRSDPRQTGSVRYNRQAGKSGTNPLVILGSSPRGDLDAAFTVHWDIPNDFRPRKETTKDEGDPAVSFLVGGVDIDVATQRNKETKKNVLVRPMSGTFVRVTRDNISIVRVVESSREAYEGKAFDDKIVAAKAFKKTLPSGTRVDVAVRGGKVFASVAGTTVQAKASDDVLGFPGLQFSGDGYVHITSLHIDGQARGAVAWEGR